MPLSFVTVEDLTKLNDSLQEQLKAIQASIPIIKPVPQQIPGFTLWSFPADVGAPKLSSLTETAVGLTFTTSCHTVAQFEDQPFARPDRMALDLVTLGKGNVDFYLYAWSADQSVNAAQFASTPTLKLIKQVNMATDIDNHRYHKYFSLSQDEIDNLMTVKTKYGLILGLRYKAQPGSQMSSLNASVLTAYKV